MSAPPAERVALRQVIWVARRPPCVLAERSMVWVLIVVLMGPGMTDTVTNLGTYAAQADCQKVAEAARKVHDIRPDRFQCVEVQKLPG